MQWNAVRENWPAFVEPIMQRWPQTEEEDLLALEGDRERLSSYLAERHELTPQEADEQITAWLQGAVPADVVMDETRDNEQIHASAAHIGEGEDVYSDDRDFGDADTPERPIGRES
ncbi:hypothetical protein LX81_01137 [Palleronia aestuarii]|uniref:Uncharacterized protein n=1 Tax=Palleronia aestuarii TaxID=568105 RepID=A0A2W7NG85_9RHOB|nr:hypothetical protein [Palleronia aestuarii]PZX18503.1 hypothetical protein LX81_01137 [Palleronia aestuarii]